MGTRISSVTDDPAELDVLRSKAAAGDAKSQLDPALRCRDGKGVVKDDAETGQLLKLGTFSPDHTGFDQATATLKSERDAGRPVVADFKYIGPQYPGGSAGHGLNACGHIAAESLYILCNPSVATPGVQPIAADDLKNFWSSDHYGALSKCVRSRPAFVIGAP